MTAEELKEIISKDIELEKIDKNELKEVIGECPVCKKPVYEGEKTFIVVTTKIVTLSYGKRLRDFLMNLQLQKQRQNHC